MSQGLNVSRRVPAPSRQQLSSDRPGVDRGDPQQVARGELARSPYQSLHSVECAVENGTAVLRGRVRSYFLKQMAQHLVAQTRGIHRVHNELHVA